MDRDGRSVLEKKQRILDAAQRLFTRFGPKKTSIDEIAQMAGIGKGTIYLYFRSKEEIFAGVVERFIAGMIATMRTAIEPHAAAEKRLHELILTRLRYVDERVKQQAIPREILLEFQDSEHSPSLSPIIRSFAEQQVRMIRELIEDGILQGAFEQVNTELTALAVYSVLEAAGKPWSYDGYTMTLENKVQTLCDLFLRGLLKRS